MFTCNNLSLLTFTYYLKIFLSVCMTIIPFSFLEITLIKFLQRKESNLGINKYFLKKELKNFFIVLIIFMASFSIHMVINTDTNTCNMYAKKEIIEEYKENYEILKKSDLSDSIKEQYLESVLLIAYNNYTYGKTEVDVSVDEVDKSDVKVQQISNNFLKETDLRKMNNVYVKDGTFYYPKYVYGNYSTYSGTSCPSNPESEGYNNPYGYNNYFYNRLTKFINEASKQGYKITLSSQGCRTYATQVNYYATMTPGRAASPGYSMHGYGIASDLEFYQKDGSVCSYGRTDSSCPSMGWAHQNASKFGLTFPLLYASYREDWHIEPISKSSY